MDIVVGGNGEGKGEGVGGGTAAGVEEDDCEVVLVCGMCGADGLPVGLGTGADDGDEDRLGGCECCLAPDGQGRQGGLGPRQGQGPAAGPAGASGPSLKRKRAPGAPTKATVAAAADAAATAAQQQRRAIYSPFPETSCEYASVRGLLSYMDATRNQAAERAIKAHVFVGVVDQQWAAAQLGTKLLLLNHRTLAKTLFFQLALRRFGVVPAMTLEHPVNCAAYVRAALDSPQAQWTPLDGDKDELTKTIVTVLTSRAELLLEYYKIGIDDKGYLYCLPELLVDYRPSAYALPIFLLRLATDTNWEVEQPCFSDIATTLATFYAALPPPVVFPSPPTTTTTSSSSSSSSSSATPTKPKPRSPLDPAALAIVQHTFFPAMQSYLKLPDALSRDGTIMQVAELDKLYRVFERC